MKTAIAATRDSWYVIQPLVNCTTFIQEPTNESSLTCDRILGNIVNVLLPLFQPIDFKSRLYSICDVVRSLIYASSNSTSITQTCNALDKNPSRRDVQYHISELNIFWVELVVNRILQTMVNKTAVLQQQQSQALNIAIDLTEIPYYGEPKNKGEVRHGMAKSGTTHFFAYASAYVILYGRRFTIDVKYVRAEELLVDVVRYLLPEIFRMNIRIKCLFLDKGFFTASVINYLKSKRIRFIIAAFPRGRKSGGLWELAKRRSSFITSYMMTDSKTGEECRFKLYTVVKYRKKRYKKKCGRQYMFYATTNLVNVPTERMFEEYCKRFGIESSYKIMKKSRAITSSKSAVLRFLYILISFVIQNEWIYDKWSYLSKITAGSKYGRKYDIQFTYFFMLQFIRLALEKMYGIINSIPINNNRYIVVTGGCCSDSGYQ